MPEPISMSIFLGYAAIQSFINLVVRPASNWVSNALEGDKKQTQTIELKDYQHKLDMDTLQATKELDWVAKEHFQRESFNQRLEEAWEQYKIQMKKWQEQAFDQRIWPLKTPYENFSLEPVAMSSSSSLQVVPCRIFTAKSNKTQFYSRYLENTVNSNIAEFLEKGYNLEGTHPTISCIGDWRSDDFQEDAFINALWLGLHGQPIIILNPVSVENGDALNLRISFWGLGTHNPHPAPNTSTVGKMNLARKTGLLIRQESRQLMELGLLNVSQELKFNFDLLNSEDAISPDKQGLFIEKNIERYRMASEVVSYVNRELSKQIGQDFSCFAGLYSDIYHLTEYGTAPIMPSKMFYSSPDYELSEDFGKFYRGVLLRLAVSGYHGSNIPKIYLNAAEALSAHPKMKHEATGILWESVSLWASNKNASIKDIPQDFEQCMRLFRDCQVTSADISFVNDVAKLLEKMGNAYEAKALLSNCTTNMKKASFDMRPPCPFSNSPLESNQTHIYNPRKGGF